MTPVQTNSRNSMPLEIMLSPTTQASIEAMLATFPPSVDRIKMLNVIAQLIYYWQEKVSFVIIYTNAIQAARSMVTQILQASGVNVLPNRDPTGFTKSASINVNFGVCDDGISAALDSPNYNAIFLQGTSLGHKGAECLRNAIQTSIIYSSPNLVPIPTRKIVVAFGSATEQTCYLTIAREADVTQIAHACYNTSYGLTATAVAPKQMTTPYIQRIPDSLRILSTVQCQNINQGPYAPQGGPMGPPPQGGPMGSPPNWNGDNMMF